MFLPRATLDPDTLSLSLSPLPPPLHFTPTPFSASVTKSPSLLCPNASLKTLMVGSNLELNLKVRVWNDGEDSYGTAVTFFSTLQGCLTDV